MTDVMDYRRSSIVACIFRLSYPFLSLSFLFLTHRLEEPIFFSVAVIHVCLVLFIVVLWQIYLPLRLARLLCVTYSFSWFFFYFEIKKAETDRPWLVLNEDSSERSSLSTLVSGQKKKKRFVLLEFRCLTTVVVFISSICVFVCSRRVCP